MISQENLLQWSLRIENWIIKTFGNVGGDAEFYFVDHLFIAHPLYRNLSDENATCGTR